MYKVNPKTRKVFELSDNGYHFTVIYHQDCSNHYWLYENWYDNGEHRKLITKYADMKSCLCHLVQLM